MERRTELAAHFLLSCAFVFLTIQPQHIAVEGFTVSIPWIFKPMSSWFDDEADNVGSAASAWQNSNSSRPTADILLSPVKRRRAAQQQQQQDDLLASLINADRQRLLLPAYRKRQAAALGKSPLYHMGYVATTTGRRRHRRQRRDTTATIVNRCQPVQRLTIRAHDHIIDIELQHNTPLVGDGYKFVVNDQVRKTRSDPGHFNGTSCHYHLVDADVSAALSVFDDAQLHGVVHMANVSLRVMPIKQHPSMAHTTAVNARRRGKRDATTDFAERYPHLVELMHHVHEEGNEDLLADTPQLQELVKNLRTKLPEAAAGGDTPPAFQCAVDVALQCPEGETKCEFAWHPPPTATLRRNPIALVVGPKTLELGVFLDASSYGNFVGKVFSSDEDVENFLTSFINQVALLYKHPSLGDVVDVQIVHMEVYESLERQPFDDAGGDLSPVFKNFSPFQKSRNPANELDPGHWDLALLLTGEDLNNKGQSRSAMGAALIGSLCDPDKSIALVELGTASDPQYHQDSGFLAAYSTAHEIGHTIGLTHDADSGSDCQTTAFIMAPTRNFRGQTAWSQCSRKQFSDNVGKHSCLTDKPSRQKRAADDGSDLPGQIYTANDQCKIHLKDVSWLRDERQPLGDICNVLKCASDKSSYPVAVGPALDGTFCGGQNWCSQGSCQSWSPFNPQVTPGGWSAWQPSDGQCQSSCTSGAVGVRIMQRTCTSPKRRNTNAGCDGERVKREVCTNFPPCKMSTTTTDKFATAKCNQWSKTSEYVATPGQQRMSADDDSCKIYCMDPTKKEMWNPQTEVKFLLGEDATFPDGTPCGGSGMYCMNKRCVKL